MLTELLQEIARGRQKNKTGIARALGLSEARVDEGIRQLVRAGYLKEEIPAGCETGCSGCLRHCADRMPVFLTLTPKGKDFISQ